MLATKTLISVLCWAACQLASAQSPPTASPAARTPTDAEVAAAAKKYGAPSISAFQTAPQGIDKMPAARTTAVDLDQIAGGYAREVQGQLRTESSVPGIGFYIFISLGLPRPTLDRIFDQAARAQATVVIRGLDGGSMQKTLQRIKELIGTRRVAVQIDPQAFERFAVVSVPCVVLTHTDGQCGPAFCPATGFVKATGDVSLDYVLERFAQVPSRAAEANHRLQLLRGRP